MFDYFHPVPKLKCPACGKGPYDWKGYDGPGRSLVWAQGQAAPVDQKSGPGAPVRRGDRDKLRLPLRFAIQGVCRCPSLLEAVGWTVEGVWSRTELLNAFNAVRGQYESEETPSG